MIDESEIQRVTLAVYRSRLDDNHQGDADRQLKNDACKDPNDNGAKQLRRAQAYRPMVIATLVALGLYEKPPAGPKKRDADVLAPADEGGAFG